jgi:hypothetical protein
MPPIVNKLRGMSAINQFGFAFLALLTISSGIPFMVRSMVGFGLLAAVFLCFVVAPPMLKSQPWTKLFLALNVMFVIFGLVVVALSFMGYYDGFTLWPVEQKFIGRQAYFIFLWLPIGYASLCFWAWNKEAIFNFFGRYGLLICAGIIVLDLATSKLLGDARTVEWVQYQFFLDKLILAFIFVLSATCYIAHNPSSWSFIGMLLVSAVLYHVLKLGILFNAQTGTILTLILVIAWFPFVSLQMRAVAVCVLVLAMHVVLTAGMFNKNAFKDDANTLWRLNAWTNNWSMVWETNSMGMGFGTPYHQRSAENLRNSAMNEGDLMQNGPVSLEDTQYFRGQHSSVVNIFYRLGLVGGVLFVLINAFALGRCCVGIKNAHDPTTQKLFFVGAMLLSVQIIQMSLHVGLETPRFLVVYMLSLGLCAVSPRLLRTSDYLFETSSELRPAFSKGNSEV